MEVENKLTNFQPVLITPEIKRGPGRPRKDGTPALPKQPQVVSTNASQQQPIEHMSSSQTHTALTMQEMEYVLKLLQSGKSLPEIGKLLIGSKYEIVDRTAYYALMEEHNKLVAEKAAEISAEPERMKQLLAEIQAEELQKKEVKKETMISLKVEYKLDDTKSLIVGLEEPMGDRTLMEAQDEAYLKLLTSLDNLVAQTK